MLLMPAFRAACCLPALRLLAILLLITFILLSPSRKRKDAAIDAAALMLTLPRAADFMLRRFTPYLCRLLCFSRVSPTPRARYVFAMRYVTRRYAAAPLLMRHEMMAI